MKMLYLLILVSAQAAAWPWTTVDDCVEKHVAKAESGRGAKIVRFACQEKYGKKNGNDDLAECLLDKVPPAKTDDAAGMIQGICQRENPTKPQSNEDYWAGFEDFKRNLQTPGQYDEVDARLFCRYTNGGTTAQEMAVCAGLNRKR